MTKLFLYIVFIFLIYANTYAWTVTKNFESGSVGEVSSGSSGLDIIFESSTQSIYDNTRAHSGLLSMRNHFLEGDDQSPGDATSSGGQINYSARVDDGGEVWARIYLWLPTGTDWSWDSYAAGYVIKFFRIYTFDASGDQTGYLSIFANENEQIVVSNENDGLGNHERDTVTEYSRGVWQSLEIYVKLSSTAGIIRIWKDGILAVEETTNRTLTEENGWAQNMLVWTYWNGGAPQDQNAWVDDIVITTDAPANRDSYDNPMIGPTDWGNTAIVNGGINFSGCSLH